MKTQILPIVAPFRFKPSPHEYKIIPIREAAAPDAMALCDTPELAAAYWRANVPAHPAFDPELECFVALLLNVRRRIKAHHLISIGTMDTILVHPSSVFRLAVMTSAAALIMVHNHPSGDPTPSESDVKMTRDYIRAGELLKIQVMDHIVMGHPGHQPKGYSSLRELGYFYS